MASSMVWRILSAFMRCLAYENGLGGMFSGQDTTTRNQLRAFLGTIKQYIPILAGSFGAAMPTDLFD
jgi:hypothetical protein